MRSVLEVTYAAYVNRKEAEILTGRDASLGKEKELLKVVLDKLGGVNNLNENNDMSFDFLGKIYEKNLNHSERKPLGEFFTSKPIVDYILSAIEYKTNYSLEDKKLIDISCGSGSFIIQAVKKLVYYFKNLFMYSQMRENKKLCRFNTAKISVESSKTVSSDAAG